MSSVLQNGDNIECDTEEIDCSENCDTEEEEPYLEAQDNGKFESIRSVLDLNVHDVIKVIKKLPFIERFEIVSIKKHKFRVFAQHFNDHYNSQIYDDYFAWVVNDVATNTFKLLIQKMIPNLNELTDSTIDLDIF